MSDFHRYLGFVVPAIFLILALWTAAGLIRNKPPGENFWRVLAGAQVVLGVQIIAGGIMYLFMDMRGPEWRHYTYGLLFPLFLLLMGHRLAKRYEDIPWVVFGIVAFLNFGLTVQALRTGLEVGG